VDGRGADMKKAYFELERMGELPRLKKRLAELGRAQPNGGRSDGLGGRAS